MPLYFSRAIPQSCGHPAYLRVTVDVMVGVIFRGRVRGRVKTLHVNSVTRDCVNIRNVRIDTCRPQAPVTTTAGTR